VSVRDQRGATSGLGSREPDGPLRIALSSFYLPSESKIGAGYQAHGLAQALVDAGHHVTLFSPCRRPDDARYEHRLVEVPGPLRTFRWALRLRAQDFDEFDVFHAAGDDYWFVGKRRPAHVRTMHGSCLAEAAHIRGVKERVRMTLLGLGEVLATLVADRTVLVSENTRRWFPWVRTVIPNGVDLALFRPEGAREPDPTILFVGTYHNRKRGRLLAESFAAEILPALPTARLWMVCTDAPGASGVEVLGRLTDEDLADRYRRAWVFCLPSTYEGFGVPYIEALASGAPVVATPNVGAREVLDEGRFGVLSDDTSLGADVLALLRDEPRRAHLAKVGADRAADYDWAVVVSRYEAIYRELLATPRRRGARARR
jgi:glycosyltransferase involved in cell wall biosynthesis